MYPNWNPRNTRNIFSFFLCSCWLLWFTLLLSAVSERSFFQALQLPQNAAAVLGGETISATATCAFQNWLLRILLSWLSWLCPLAVLQSPVQAQVQFEIQQWALLVDWKDFFFPLWLHMWGVFKKGHLVLVFGSSSYPYFLLHWAEGNIVCIRFFKSLSTLY